MLILRARGVETEASQASSAANINSRSVFPNLQNDPLRYAHGLTGVDQEGNYLWSNVILICFMGLLVGVIVLRLTKMAVAQMRHLQVMANPTSQGYWATNQTTWWPWLKQHVFMAPLFSKRHNKEFQLSKAISNGTLPGRFHTLILLVYVLSNAAYCLALPYHRKNAESILAALRGRAGTLATLNLIPTVLFALRNNPFISLLRVSYDDFNLLHRWAARLVVVESIVHGLAWFANTYRVGKWNLVGYVLNTTTSYAWGMVGTVLFTFIFFQASSPVRHAFYDTFLNLHRLSVLFALVGVYVHLDTHKLPQVPWMHLIVTLWSLEWFCRLASIAYYNLSYRHGLTRVVVEAMPGEASRLTLTLARPWRPRPGCHVHLFIPRLAFWDSHPFSVAWSDTPNGEATSPTKKSGDLPMAEKDDTGKAPSKTPTSTSISLICRARTGFTRAMYRRASAMPNGRFTAYAAIEGPYGGHEKLNSYGTVILFAGGVGITHQVMFVRELVKAYKEGTAAVQKLLLVWTIPDTECLEWVRHWMDEILYMPRRREVLRICVFVTRPKGGQVRSASETVQMFPGRPKIPEIMDKEVKERVGAVVVQCCAAGAFADDVRAAVRPKVQDGVVDFIEEAFTY